MQKFTFLLFHNITDGKTCTHIQFLCTLCQIFSYTPRICNVTEMAMILTVCERARCAAVGRRCLPYNGEPSRRRSGLRGCFQHHASDLSKELMYRQASHRPAYSLQQQSIDYTLRYFTSLATYRLMLGFHHSVTVLPLPFRRSAVVKFHYSVKKLGYVRKFRSVTALNGNKLP